MFFIGYTSLAVVSAIMLSYIFQAKRKTYSLLSIAALMTMLAARFFRRPRPDLFHSVPVSEIVSFTAYFLIGSVLIISLILTICAVVYFVLDREKKQIRRPIRILIPFALCLLCVSFALYGGLRHPAPKYLEIHSQYIPESLDGYRIVQLSDIHLDSRMKMRHFRKTVDIINSLNPDLVLITGDVIDPGVDTSSNSDGFFSAIKARDGVYASMGNHEVYYSVLANPAQILRRMGLNVLDNESVNLERLRITGIGDIYAEKIPTKKVMSLIGNDASMPEIVMTHRPILYEEIAKKRPLLVLSGHTHRGQIFPFSLIVKLVNRYFYGYYRIADTHFYVTSGTDAWGPRMRFLAPSEIPVITLKKGN